MGVTHVEKSDEEDQGEKCGRERAKRWRVERKDERSGRRVINGSRDRKSPIDHHHLTRPVAAVAQFELYVPYVIPEREKKIVYITGLDAYIQQEQRKVGGVYGKRSEGERSRRCAH